MIHALTLAIMTFVTGALLMWWRRRGPLGAKKVYTDMKSELDTNNRVVLRPKPNERLDGTGELIIDGQGLTITANSGIATYTWPNINGPFRLDENMGGSKITFAYREANPRFGQRALFRNTKDEFVDVRKTIECAYSMGWGNLNRLLNDGRDAARSVGTI